MMTDMQKFGAKEGLELTRSAEYLRDGVRVTEWKRGRKERW